MALIKRVVFPPLPAERVESFLNYEIGGMTWQERFRRYQPQEQQQIANALVTGISSGENLQGLRPSIEAIIGGPSYRAQRIVRTESNRVAQLANQEAVDAMGDMVAGMQIIAVMDHWTRPHHAARNGRIYHRQADDSFRDEAGNVLPQLPDEPNCRCMAVEVLRPPKEFENSPIVRTVFKNDSADLIPDPSTYADWFERASLGSRKLAVGSGRYNAMAEVLAPTGRPPEWVDFIDAEGRLLPVGKLRSETPAARADRRRQVQAILAQREALFKEVSRQGFVRPPVVADLSPAVGAAPRKLEGHEIDALLNFGTARDVRITVKTPDELDRAALALFGSHLQHEQLVNLAGGVERSAVEISASADSITLKMTAENVTSTTIVGRGAKGELTIRFVRTDVAEGAQRGGISTRRRAGQILQAKRLGIRRAELNASGSKADVGYKVWPKMGFDARLPPAWAAEHRQQLGPGLESAVWVSELMVYPEGRQVWDEYGFGIDLGMSLRDTSQGVQNMAKYVQRKRKEWAQRGLSEDRPAVEPDFDWEADEQIFNEIWDEIRQLRESGVVFTDLDGNDLPPLKKRKQ